MSEKRCYTCYWHSYDWFDDGDEFEVCKKGNEIGRICKDYLDFDNVNNTFKVQSEAKKKLDEKDKEKEKN